MSGLWHVLFLYICESTFHATKDETSVDKSQVETQKLVVSTGGFHKLKIRGVT